PAIDVRRIVRSGRHHVHGEEVAFTADGNGDPGKLLAVFARGEESEAARVEFFAGELFGDVAYGKHSAASKNNAFECGRFVRKTEDAARRDEFCNLRRGQSEAAFSETEKHE